jgi:hypothetical protein
MWAVIALSVAGIASVGHNDDLAQSINNKRRDNASSRWRRPADHLTTGDATPPPGQAHVYRATASQQGQVFGGYTIVLPG